MRKFLITMALMTMVLVALLVAPVVAQRRPGGRGFGGDPVTNPAVQAALKMTDAQKKAAQEIRAKATEEANKKIRESLTSEQKKRLGQIELQMAETSNDLNLFTKDDVIKTLSLSKRQVQAAKDAIADIAKDVKELQDDAKGDRRKLFRVFTRTRELRKEAWDKVVATLSADQKKAWETAKGEKFEQPRFPGFGGRDKGKGKGKGKGKKRDEI